MIWRARERERKLTRAVFCSVKMPNTRITISPLFLAVRYEPSAIGMRYATMTIVDTDAEDKDVGGEDATKNAVREDTVTLPIFFDQDNEDEDTPDLASLAFDVRRRFLACFPPNVFRKDLLRQDQIESLLGKIRKYRSKKRATSRRLADKEKKKSSRM